MKPLSLDIPHNNDELAHWITGHMLSRNLAVLVAELAAIHSGSRAETFSLDAVLGNERQTVLENGLKTLSHSRLVQLLRRPTLLLELQELVLVDGGPPWQLTDIVDDELQHRREDCWMRLRQDIDKQQWHTFTTRESPQPVLPTGTRSAPIAIILVTTTLLITGILVWQIEFGPFRNAVATEAWGWNRPTQSTEEAGSPEYWNRLADAAGEWFDKRPLTREHLANRILDFRQGCAVMRLREKKRLPADDREWLTRRLREWSKSLDAELVRLEEGDDVIEVRDAIDRLTREIAAELRARAKM